MKQRLFVPAKLCDQLHNILQVVFGVYGFGNVRDGSHHTVFPCSVLNNLPLFAAVNKAVVDAERYVTAVAEVGKNRLFLSSGRILTDRPDAVVSRTAQIAVGVEFDGAGRDAVEEILNSDFFFFGFCRFMFLLKYHH